MRRKGRVVVMVVGLVRRRRGVAVVVVRRVVRRRLLHTWVRSLMEGMTQWVNQSIIALITASPEEEEEERPTRVCQGAGGPTLW